MPEGPQKVEMDRNMRLGLVNAIQRLSSDQMSLLGYVVCTKQYLELDGATNDNE